MAVVLKEEDFRSRKVKPFLDKLHYSYFEKIQNKTIRGVADYLGCICGRFIAIELKSSRGKLEALQEYKLNQIVKSGGFAFVASPNNWEEVKQYLDDIQEEKILDSKELLDKTIKSY